MVLPASRLLSLPCPALRQPGLDLPPGPYCLKNSKTGGLGSLHPSTPGLSPAPVYRGWWVCPGCLWPVGGAPSPQDLARTGVKSCLKGTGGTDHAGQFPQPPSPPVVTCHGSWAPHLFLCRLHLNPPSCLISKTNSVSDKSMGRSCFASSLALSLPHKSDRQGVPPGSSFEAPAPLQT